MASRWENANSAGEGFIPPSTLFVLWPGQDPPMAEEIGIRLRDWGGTSETMALPPEGTLWSFWLQLAHRPTAQLIWCEPAEGAYLQLLDRVHWPVEGRSGEARRCRWVVGVEGTLALHRPNRDYWQQLQIAEAIGLDEAPAIYDASSFMFRSAEEIQRLLGNHTPPSAESLFTIHKVKASHGDFGLGDPTYWLHTHGLERAGIPDLELFHVPERLVNAGCELLLAVAELWLATTTPEPETPTAIGLNLDVCWRPWQAVAADLPPRAVGGWTYRRDEFGHTGYRAVLTNRAPANRTFLSPTERWTVPLEVLDRLQRPETTLFKPTSESDRRAKLAREKWGVFGLLFASRPPAHWRFAAKLAFDRGQGSGREHLWFDILAIRPGLLHTALVSTAVDVPELATTAVGSQQWYSLDRLSDWRIMTDRGSYGPESAELLLDYPSLAEPTELATTRA